MTIQNTHLNVKPTLAAVRHASPERHLVAERHQSPDRRMAPAPQRSEARERHVAAEPHTPTGGPLGNFSHVTALTRPIYVNPNDTISLYRARMDNKDVILKALKGSCFKSNTDNEKQICKASICLKILLKLQFQR